MIVNGVDLISHRGMVPCTGGGSHVEEGRGWARVRGFRTVNLETTAGRKLARALIGWRNVWRCGEALAKPVSTGTAENRQWQADETNVS